MRDMEKIKEFLESMLFCSLFMALVWAVFIIIAIFNIKTTGGF